MYKKNKYAFAADQIKSNQTKFINILQQIIKSTQVKTEIK